MAAPASTFWGGQSGSKKSFGGKFFFTMHAKRSKNFHFYANKKCPMPPCVAPTDCCLPSSNFVPFFYLLASPSLVASSPSRDSLYRTLLHPSVQLRRERWALWPWTVNFGCNFTFTTLPCMKFIYLQVILLVLVYLTVLLDKLEQGGSMAFLQFKKGHHPLQGLLWQVLW